MSSYNHTSDSFSFFMFVVLFSDSKKPGSQYLRCVSLSDQLASVHNQSLISDIIILVIPVP